MQVLSAARVGDYLIFVGIHFRGSLQQQWYGTLILNSTSQSYDIQVVCERFTQ
jgi:hypothetical protein